MTLEEVWNAALGEIELSISKAQFNTWFKGTCILSLENDRVSIRVSNGFAKEWLENKYHLIILKSLNNLGYSVKEIRCKVEGPQEKESQKSLGIDAVSAPIPQKEISPKKEDSSSFERNNQTFSQKETPFFSQRHNQSFQSNINPRYTFENFIVGTNNELARAACLAVCEDLGSIYNPLFLYGGVGLGKTHLLQSIGNTILNQNNGKKVLYITSEKFTQELINSIKKQTVDQFKDQYSAIDLLIIDDVQFLSGREKTQNEFFHIFNTLYQQNKQIVISSDRPPKAIGTLEDRLRSRFEGGMIADINKPEFETRIAILQEKAQEKSLSLSDEIIIYIAENITSNIRELEGALNRLTAIQQFHHLSHLTLDDAKNILKELISSGKKKVVTHQDIIRNISEFYEISSEDLKQKGRKKEVATARQIAMYFMRKELNMPYTGIGRCFGGRDHTTALHAFEKIKKLIEQDEKIKKDIHHLKEKLYSIS